MNNQEIFDIVSKHLLAQNKKALTGLGSCAYRGGDDCKCAIGVLIDDKAYGTNLEGYPVLEDAVVNALAKSGVSTDYETMLLLIELQNTHDKFSPPQWGQRLRTVSKQFNLEYLE